MNKTLKYLEVIHSRLKERIAELDDDLLHIHKEPEKMISLWEDLKKIFKK